VTILQGVGVQVFTLLPELRDDGKLVNCGSFPEL
jgi:hypothetical protein